MKWIHIIVKGKVQGVFFRKYTYRKAVELHISGWVKNMADASVEITAQGDEESIKLFVEWCREGPPSASVEEVIIKEATQQIFNGFEILK